MVRLTGRMGLWTRCVVLVGAVGLVVLAAYLLWSSQVQRSETERHALGEARVLALEIQAAWDYVDSIQSRINYTKGDFDFKNVYCAVAGKSIAKRFSAQSDYSIRYVRDDPRNKADSPDDFEAAALAQFEGGGPSEYYGLVEYEGQSVFRYVAMLEAKANCLSCHGDPVGQKDVTGYLREGMQLGDVAGAVSIIMPMAAMQADAQSNLVGSVVFFCVLMASASLVLAWGLRRWAADPILHENEQLRDESEAQKSFLATITHELKTPLSSIIAFTELWKKKTGSAASEDRELVEEVEMSSRALLGMIENVLDTARMEAGSLVPVTEDVDACDVALLVKSTMGPLGRKCGIRFETFVNPRVPVVRTDREMLRRIVTNLVSNAFRYSGEGDEVILSMDYEDGVLVVEVRDTGSGIAADQLDRIFDRFVRAGYPRESSEGGRNGGTGLGLSIVKSYAEMMGGDVSVRSVLGEGSAFTVRLPAVSCEE